MKTHILTLIIGFCLIAFSCEKDNTNTKIDPSDGSKNKVIGTGPLVEQTLSVDQYSKLSNAGVANITISKGTSQTTTLKAQQNILDVMEYGVNSNILEVGIKNGNSIETDKGIFIDIVTNDPISSINIAGVGEASVKYGQQSHLDIVISGEGTINATETEVENCNIAISGVGTCNVNVTSQLSVSVAGVGYVNYKGSPKVSKSIAGVGSVSPL